MRRVLITGAGAGIGLACTKKFLQEGWNVLAHYNSSVDELNKLKLQYPSHLDLIRADLSSQADLEKFLKQLKTEKLTELINNAGMYDLSKNAKDRIKAVQEVLQVNLIAPTLILETVFEGMKVQKRGAIINISSIGAHYGSNSPNVFYSASKRGLEAVTKTFAREGAPFQICINTIRPGVTNTDFHRKAGKDVQKRIDNIPMKRLVEPEDVAKLVFTTCTNHCVTNQIISIANGD